MSCQLGNMAVIDQMVGEAAHLVARATSLEATTSSTGSAAASSTSSDHDDKGGGGGSSSPLLFFVALGFGVVFTNLW